MKMQAGSAGLHCAVAGRHWPFAQKVPAGQLTLAQAFACCWVGGTEHVPSDWQRPSPQSESLLHRFWPATLPEPGLPLPQAAAITTARSSPRSPRPPIAHLRPHVRVAAKEVVNPHVRVAAKEVVIGALGGKRLLESPLSAVRHAP